MIDDVDVVAHLLKGLKERKALNQSPIVIHIVECEYSDFHKKIRKTKNRSAKS
jgi:hypothetical protein